MERQQIIKELRNRLPNQKLFEHALAMESIMIDLAQLLNENPFRWGIVGLMHDIDIGGIYSNEDDNDVHGEEILESMGFDSTIIYAVKAHNEKSGLERRRKIDKALYCADQASLLIIASVMAKKSKKITSININNILKNFENEDFAPDISRIKIRGCEQLGMSVEKFLYICFEAMLKVSESIGL